MDWAEVTRRVVVAAVEAHPQDQVLELGCGSGEILRRLAPNIRKGIGVERRADALAAARQGAPENLSFFEGDFFSFPLPKGTSVVVMHDVLRHLPTPQQRALLERLGTELSDRGLLVIGDVIWSCPPEQLDEPEQYGSDLKCAPSAEALEAMVRSAGFLPDLHRFGPGRAVMIALRSRDPGPTMG